MLPPLHKVDGPIDLVLVEDEAWDKEKLAEETAEMSAEEKGEHPWYQYHLGETRYDLQQVKYLMREGTAPTVFSLKRLDYLQWRAVEELARSNERAANDLALVYGLIAVKNGDDEVRLRGPESDSKRLTDGDCKELVARFGYERVQRVGAACRSASGDLTEREKKASD